MSDYSKTTNFTAKDALPSGNAGKLIKGSDFDLEFTAVETAVATKQDESAALTSFVGLAIAANKIPYGTAANTYGMLDFKDEDDMVSDSATALPSQQSVKAYVGTAIPAITNDLIANAAAATPDVAADYFLFEDATDTTHKKALISTITNPIVLSTAQTLDTKTSVAFAVPNTVKRVTVMFKEASPGSTSPVIVQLGTGGAAETTNYLGSVANSAGESRHTNGFRVRSATGTDGEVYSGAMVLNHFGSNTWVCHGAVSDSDAANNWSFSGSKALAGALDYIVVTTVNGTDVFDGGSVNISYE